MVILTGWLFIVAGVIGLGYHATEFNPQAAFDIDLALVLLIRFLAIVGGVFVLRGANWARWLLVIWIGYHVILSASHSVSELVIHCAILGGVAYVLFRPQSSQYFRTVKPR